MLGFTSCFKYELIPFRGYKVHLAMTSGANPCPKPFVQLPPAAKENRIKQFHNFLCLIYGNLNFVTVTAVFFFSVFENPSKK